MITIRLKAKHFYFIVNNIKNSSIQYFFSLVSRIKGVLTGNSDLEAEFTVNATVDEIVYIFKILTTLPEGQAATINAEMDTLLLPQIQSGVIGEMMGGIASTDENAHWQRLAASITAIKNESASIRNAAIQNGKNIIDAI